MTNIELKEIPAKAARVGFGQLISKAHFGGEQFLITKKTKPMAVVIGIHEFRELRKPGLTKAARPRRNIRFPVHKVGKLKTPITREYIYEDY